MRFLSFGKKKRWVVVLCSEVFTEREYYETAHKWKWQAVLAARQHHLYNQPTWRIEVRRM